MPKPLDSFVKIMYEKLGGRSANWLSQASGLTQSKLSRILNKKNLPDLEDIVAIAIALECKPGELLEGGSAKQEISAPTLSPDILRAIRDATKEAAEEGMIAARNALGNFQYKAPASQTEAPPPQEKTAQLHPDDDANYPNRRIKMEKLVLTRAHLLSLDQLENLVETMDTIILGEIDASTSVETDVVLKKRTK